MIPPITYYTKVFLLSTFFKKRLTNNSKKSPVLPGTFLKITVIHAIAIALHKILTEF